MKALIDKYRDRHWLPDYYADSSAAIDFEYLKKSGIKACLFDLDHTLLVHGQAEFDIKTLEVIKKSGLDIYIATNRRYSEALDIIASELNAKGVMHASNDNKSKPSKTYYKKAVELVGFKPQEIAMIGDRLLQDIWGANRVGLNTVLVRKLGIIKWYDQVLTIHDRLIPVIFANRYKDL